MCGNQFKTKNHVAFVKQLWLLIDWFPFTSSMARMKMTPQKREGRKTLRVRMWVEVHIALAPAEEAPPTPGEIEGMKVEAEKLEEVGRSPELSPTQQLGQMAAEAGPSTLDGEELNRRKL